MRQLQVFHRKNPQKFLRISAGLIEIIVTGQEIIEIGTSIHSMTFCPGTIFMMLESNGILTPILTQ